MGKGGGHQFIWKKLGGEVWYRPRDTGSAEARSKVKKNASWGSQERDTKQNRRKKSEQRKNAHTRKGPTNSLKSKYVSTKKLYS